MSIQVKNDEIKSGLQQNLYGDTVIIKKRLNMHLKRKIKNQDLSSLESTASTKKNVPTLSSSLLSTKSQIMEITNNKNSNKMENSNSFIKKMKIAETIENGLRASPTSTTTTSESGILSSNSIEDERLISSISTILTSPPNASTTDELLSSSSSSSSSTPLPSSPIQHSIANFLTEILNKKKVELMNNPTVINYFKNISNAAKKK